MARSLVFGLSLSALALATGCGSAAPAATSATTVSTASAAPIASAAPTAAPTTAPVAAKNGGDEDSEKAVLERLASQPWGFRRDYWNTLHVPLIDWRGWKRVRIWGHPTRATYRYGDDHEAVDTILYTAIDGPNDPEKCMAKFMDYASTTAQGYGVHLGESQLVKMSQVINDVSKPMLVKLLEGRVASILANDDYVAAIAVYQSFPGTCLVRGFAVVSTNYKELATKVRDRWVAEGAANLVWEKHVKAAPAIEAR